MRTVNVLTWIMGAIAVAVMLSQGDASGRQQHISTFEGTVWVDAEPGGNQVSATMSGTVCASVSVGQVTDGETQSFYQIEVPAAEGKPGCGVDGATVNFEIDGQSAKPPSIWKAGQIQTVHIWTGEDFAAFSGSLFQNGGPWPASDESILVEAFIGAVECGSLQQFLFGDPSYGSIRVLPDSLRPGCGRPGDTITFSVDGLPAEETAVWEAGFHTLDLSVTLPVTPTPPPLPDTGGAPAEGSDLPLWVVGLGASLAVAGGATLLRLGRRA